VLERIGSLKRVRIGQKCFVELNLVPKLANLTTNFICFFLNGTTRNNKKVLVIGKCCVDSRRHNNKLESATSIPLRPYLRRIHPAISYGIDRFLDPLPINLLNGASGITVAAVSAACGRTSNTFCMRLVVFCFNSYLFCIIYLLFLS
jgi:hypothetical protein